MFAVFIFKILNVFLPQLFLSELLSVIVYLAEEDEDDGKEDVSDSFCKLLDSSRFVRRMIISPSSLGTPFLFCLSIISNRRIDMRVMSCEFHERYELSYDRCLLHTGSQIDSPMSNVQCQNRRNTFNAVLISHEKRSRRAG
jgi:hypothetical protein